MSSGRMAINAYNMCSQQTDLKQETGVVSLGRALLSLVQLIELYIAVFPRCYAYILDFADTVQYPPPQFFHSQ